MRRHLGRAGAPSDVTLSRRQAIGRMSAFATAGAAAWVVPEILTAKPAGGATLSGPALLRGGSTARAPPRMGRRTDPGAIRPQHRRGPATIPSSSLAYTGLNIQARRRDRRGAGRRRMGHAPLGQPHAHPPGGEPGRPSLIDGARARVGASHPEPERAVLPLRGAHRDERLGRQVDALLAGLRDPVETAPVEHWYSLTAADGGPAGTVDVRRDGEELAHGQQPGDAMGWVVWDVNRAAAEAGGDHLLFHAGGIEADGTGVLLPGASGSGKSTLVAGLVRGGLGYLTDELVALEHGDRKAACPTPSPSP